MSNLQRKVNILTNYMDGVDTDYLYDVKDLAKTINEKYDINCPLNVVYNWWADKSETFAAGWLSVSTFDSHDWWSFDSYVEEKILDLLEKRY